LDATETQRPSFLPTDTAENKRSENRTVTVGSSSFLVCGNKIVAIGSLLFQDQEACFWCPFAVGVGAANLKSLLPAHDHHACRIMSLYLTSTSIVGPQLPPWLEETCQRIVDNDESLQTLDLSHPRINDNLARCVAQALQENSNNTVTALILSCFAIVDDGALALGSALGRNRGIEKLQLRDLRNQREINTFFQALLQNQQIQELSLRHR
jgi:hypothetical protein